ncbi:MAG: hypothetical protein GQ532_20750 [Methylomarinum sp.]|nr:hypothetical protein [Methylomarinum sp.]
MSDIKAIIISFLNQHQLIKEFARIVRHPIQYLLLRGVYSRIRQLEYRSFNRRYYAIEQTAEYLVGAQVQGDYCEFGVFQGTTFTHAAQQMTSLFSDMRFVAFDSFEGLPSPKGIDANSGYTSHFYETQFACSEEEFLVNMRRSRLNLSRIQTVKGWFNETLNSAVAESHGVDKISVAWIDCDLYESTVPVLDFLTNRISVGSVIIFDDWRCYRNHPDYGEQLAVREWLHKNQEIELRELFSFGWNGIAFTVTSCREGKS